MKKSFLRITLGKSLSLKAAKPAWKAVAFSCGLLASLWFAGGHAEASPSDYGVKLQVNDQLVGFAGVQPYIDSDSTLMVPLRVAAEKVGYTLEWNMKDKTNYITVKSGVHTAEISNGSQNATIDGKPVKLAKAPQLADNNMYVPIRWFADTFGLIMQWDNDNWIAIIGADGKYHAPAWYVPNPVSSVLSIADNYLGVPYVLGGTTPNGFDCSGFVKYVFDKYGVELPRTSAEMYASAGTNVSSPEAGDLVFFADRGRVFHVGLYLGNGQYINASSGKTHEVTVTNLYSSWSQTYYAGAKRVL